MVDLAGKHALVTGGGSGVGAAIAVALADAGARVTITGRRVEPLEAVAEGRRILAVTGDVTDAASVASMFETAQAENGPVDIVVANAGASESAAFHKTSLDLWNRMLSVNLTGAFLTLQAGHAQMKGRSRGRLIAVASTAGLKGYSYVSAYCAAKHGVVGLIKALAQETARSGVTANAVCPGFTETPMLQVSVDNIVNTTGRSKEEARKALSANNPQGRFIQPEEIAATVLWLCGPGSDSITGQAISVSGGEI